MMNGECVTIPTLQSTEPLSKLQRQIAEVQEARKILSKARDIYSTTVPRGKKQGSEAEKAVRAAQTQLKNRYMVFESRHADQCEICYMNGEFLVRDLGSTTGTFFYVRPHGHFLMFPGLMVKLGETELQVLSQTPVGTEPPEQVVLFYEGPLAGHKVHIPASGITIGRRHNNNLVLVQDGTVSAHHAVIFCEAGEFFLSDLGSCNGTCIRLSMERTDSDWHPIMDGDMLGAGCTKIQCRIHR